VIDDRQRKLKAHEGTLETEDSADQPEDRIEKENRMHRSSLTHTQPKSEINQSINQSVYALSHTGYYELK